MSALTILASHRLRRKPSAAAHVRNDQGVSAMPSKEAKVRRTAALQTPTTLGANATKDISAALTMLLADVFTLISRPRTSTGTCRARISATII